MYSWDLLVSAFGLPKSPHLKELSTIVTLEPEAYHQAHVTSTTTHVKEKKIEKEDEGGAATRTRISAYSSYRRTPVVPMPPSAGPRGTAKAEKGRRPRGSLRAAYFTLVLHHQLWMN
jgi:hypothetical protein